MGIEGRHSPHGSKISHAASMAFTLALLLLFTLSRAHATEEYADQTGETCIYCHKDGGGGSLTVAGLAFIRNGYQYPIPDRIIKKARYLQTSFHRILRFVLGYVHLLAAVIFFGAIFYIHIFVKPARIKGGIPKPERILGVSCMVTLMVTGSYLTWFRIDTLAHFFNTTFGVVLFIKIILFMLMVSIASMAITVVHRRMRQETRPPVDVLKKAKITYAELSAFDGSDGRPAYFAYKNKVYDVSSSPKWKNGRHMGKHAAGSDLTHELSGAPHGEDVLQGIACIGDISGEAIADMRLSPARKVFVIMTYANLIIIFLILGCISIWRWGFPIK